MPRSSFQAYTVLVNSIHQSSTTNIVAFRELLRAKFPEAHATAAQHLKAAAAAEPVRSGVSCLDGLGLAKGALTEVVGPQPGCGIGLLIASLLQREQPAALSVEPTALIDGRDAFDPWSLPAAVLDKLLWVRCRETGEAIKAADLLLRDGNIQLVLLDLQMQPPTAVRSLPLSVWHRLRMLAEKSGASLCAFTPCQIVSGARSRILLEHPFTLDDLYRSRTALAAKLTARIERTSPREFAETATFTASATSPPTLRSGTRERAENAATDDRPNKKAIA